MRDWKLWMVFIFLAVLGWVNGEVSSTKNEISNLGKSYRFIKSPIHALRQCRKHLTFLASIAVGVYATVVLKESPLTPLPLPPIDDHPPRFKLISLPSHLTSSIHKWMKRQDDTQQILNDTPSWIIRRPSSFTENLLRFGRDLGKDELSQILINEAVSRTLKPLKYLPHLLGMRNFLLKWCH